MNWATDSDVTVVTVSITMPLRTQLSRSLRIFGSLFDLTEMQSECVPNFQTRVSWITTLAKSHGVMACHVCHVCCHVCHHVVPVQSSFLGEGHTVPRGAEGQVLLWHDGTTMARRCFLNYWGHWGHCDPSGQQPMEQFCDLSAASAGTLSGLGPSVLSSQRARAADTCLAQRYDATMFSIQLKQSMLYNIKSVLPCIATEDSGISGIKTCFSLIFLILIAVLLTSSFIVCCESTVKVSILSSAHPPGSWHGQQLQVWLHLSEGSKGSNGFNGAKVSNEE